MRVSTIRIQKFRSIEDATITMDQVLALVGANNVGKSHVLRALNAFFNFTLERDSFLKHDHVFSLKARPRITVTFTDIGPDDGVLPEYIYNNRLTINFTYRWDRNNHTYEVIAGTNKQTIDLETFRRLVRHYHYIYVPIVRDYKTTFSSESGIAYNLLKAVLQQQIANRDTIKPLVDQLYRKMENTIFKTALQRIKRYYPFNDNNDFELRIDNNDLTDSIIRNVALILIEHAQNNVIGNCGSGVQSAVYFAITLATSMNEGANYLVGIEEPELNLHPQSQRQLIETLKNTTKYPNTQFVLATHSPVIVDRLGHSAIALCRKSKGRTRDIITTVMQIGIDFWDKYQMQEERYYNFFQYKNSDFFFSKYIIITESTIDCGVFTELLNKYGIDPDDVGISFIPTNGEKSVKYPYALTKELGIPFLCVVDRDVFQPYTGADRKSSLNERGIPQYKPVAKTSAPFCDLLNAEDIAKLLGFQIRGKYKAVLDLLENYSIIMMRYALEVDLVVCESYCEAFCNALQVHGEDRNSHYLLTEKNNKIKTLDVFRQVLSNTSTKNLPLSYKRIMQYIKHMIR